ncbi:hypothetical protein ACCS99_20025 [Rhizobium ruizarguesonis]
MPIDRRSLLIAGLQTAVTSPAIAQRAFTGQPSAFSKVPPTGATFGLNVASADTQADSSASTLVPDTASGRAPLVRSVEKWNETQLLFLQSYGPVQYAVSSPMAVDPPRGGKKLLTDHDYYELDCKLLGTASALSPLDDGKAEARFLYNHVDVLLNQASDILDRALSEYLAFADYSAKAASLGLEVKNFFDNDIIHNNEIAAGIYTIPYEMSLAEEKALSEKADAAKKYKDRLAVSWALQYDEESLNKSLLASQIISQMPYLVTRTSPPLGGYVSVTVGSASGVAPDLIAQAVKDSVGRSLALDRTTQINQTDLALGIVNETNARLVGATAKRKWDFADIDFQKSRTQQARNNAEQKVKLAVTPGGAFNYAEQAKASRDRFVRDLHDGIVRLKACEYGLKVIFDYDNPAPASLLARDEGVHLIQLLNDFVAWTRESVRYVAAFNLTDQGYTLTVSIKQLIGASAWADGLKSGQWTFLFGDNLVPDQYAVRLTGINMFVRPSSGTWTGNLLVPAKSYYNRAAGKPQVIDQDKVPKVRLGRIGSRQSERYQEIYGTMLLRNLSPMGIWNVNISSESTYGEPLSAIEDIEVDFDLMIHAG